MCCETPRKEYPTRSWMRPVAYITFESRIGSGHSRDNELLFPIKSIRVGSSLESFRPQWKTRFWVQDVGQGNIRVFIQKNRDESKSRAAQDQLRIIKDRGPYRPKSYALPRRRYKKY